MTVYSHVRAFVKGAGRGLLEEDFALLNTRHSFFKSNSEESTVDGRRRIWVGEAFRHAQDYNKKALLVQSFP